jgi:6,7-dimethyl-8-ribityllumazine synthase
VRTIEGSSDGSGLRIAIVAARFDKSGVMDALIEGAVKTAAECNVSSDATTLVRVPGAFELPAAAQRLAASGDYDAIVCVGSVVRGETSHFDFVAGEAARGISDVSREFGLPVTFGVITADTDEQARARAGGDVRNSGREAMLAAVEMAILFQQLPTAGGGKS